MELDSVNFPLVTLHCSKLPGHVVMLLLRSWLNMWITSRRFFKGSSHSCVFGCSSPDSLAHYSDCPLLKVFFCLASGWLDYGKLGFFGISSSCILKHGVRKSLAWAAALASLYNVAKQAKDLSLTTATGKSLEILNGALQAFNLAAGRPILTYYVSSPAFIKAIEVLYCSSGPNHDFQHSQQAIDQTGGAAEDSP